MQVPSIIPYANCKCFAFATKLKHIAVDGKKLTKAWTKLKHIAVDGKKLTKAWFPNNQSFCSGAR